MAYSIPKLLAGYAKLKKTAVVDFYGFLDFCRDWISSNSPDSEQFLSHPHLVLKNELETLEQRRTVELERSNGDIQAIRFFPYYVQKAEDLWAKLDHDPSHPMPGPDPRNFPSGALVPLDVKDELVEKLRKPDGTPVLYNMLFPEDLKPIIVPSTFLDEKLLQYSVAKIRSYLMKRENAEYMKSKLHTVFRSKPQLLKQAFSGIFSHGHQALESIMNPTDFSFQFWNHLANAVVAEFKKKENKLDQEMDYSQAAFIIGFYNLFYKGQIREKRDQESALRMVGQKIRSKPFYYTIQEIHSFKDKDGYPIAKKVSPDALNDYLKRLTTKKEGENLPSVIRITTADNKQYFVAKDIYLILLLRKINEASGHYRMSYIKEWSYLLDMLESVEAMNDDEAFHDDLFRRVKREDPFLIALLRFDYLFLLTQEKNVTRQVKMDVQSLTAKDGKSLRTIDHILGLFRRDLLSEAKVQLPFWKRNAFLVGIARAFRRLLGGGRKKNKKVIENPLNDRGEPSAAPAGGGVRSDPMPSNPGGAGAVSGPLPENLKARKVAYSKAVSKVQQEFLRDGQSAGERLKELTESWNPLFDDTAKKNLVEDVNSMVRDYLRKLSRTLKASPPDRDRILNLARDLANNDAFAKIKKKSMFIDYLALYMLELLKKA